MKLRQKFTGNKPFYWRHKINKFHAWNFNNSPSSMTLIPATALHFAKGMKSLNLNILLLPSKRFYHSAYEISPHRAIKWMTIKYLFLKCLKYCLRRSIKNINVVFSWIYVQLKGIFNTQHVDFFHKYLIRHLNRSKLEWLVSRTPSQTHLQLIWKKLQTCWCGLLKFSVWWFDNLIPI